MCACKGDMVWTMAPLVCMDGMGGARDTGACCVRGVVCERWFTHADAFQRAAAMYSAVMK